MIQLVINTQDNSFVSLSAEEANWWKKASPARREAYIKKHPKSKYANAVKTGKLKVNAPSSGTPVKPKAKATKKSKGKTSKRKEDKETKDAKSSKAKKDKAAKTKKAKVKKAPKKANKPKKQKVSRSVRAQETLIEQEEQARAKKKTPIIQNEIRDNFTDIHKRRKDITAKLDQTLSPRAKSDVNDFAAPFLKGDFNPKDATPEQKRGVSKVGQILDGITEGIIGRSRYNNTAKTLGHVLLSLFMGPTNYKGIKSIIEEGRASKQAEFESTSSNIVRRKREHMDPFTQSVHNYYDDLVSVRIAHLSSLSNEDREKEIDEEEQELEREPEQLKTLETLIDSYLTWFKQLDANKLAEKMAMLESIHEMKKEEYKPDPVAVQNLLDQEDAENEEQDVPPELEQFEFESDSSTRPRLSFRVCPKQKRLSHEQRSRYDVVFDGREVGSLISDPNIKGNGKARRSWKVRLIEGFNETAFKSGKHETQPYTLVNSNRVLLMHPVHQTFDESKNWVKHVIHKDFL